MLLIVSKLKPMIVITKSQISNEIGAILLGLWETGQFKLRFNLNFFFYFVNEKTFFQGEKFFLILSNPSYIKLRWF